MTVTPMPTTRAAMIVRLETTSSMLVTLNPRTFIKERRSYANATPPPRPRIEAVTPTMSASKIALNLT